MYPPRFSKATIILAGALISGPGATGQSQPPPSSNAQAAQPSAPATAPASDSTVLHASANLVLVDVVVTADGAPIHGLDRTKFHIFEDGHEQVVTSFDEHQGAKAAMATPNVVKLPPNTFSNTPPYPENGVVNVLLLDGLNTPIAN